jgi:serine/threonine protein kinase
MINKLGKYELHEKLGEGATAVVYRAVDTSLRRVVAVKVLKPALGADPSSFERFRQEAQAASSLFHPNVATVLDMGEADGRYYIVMRYIPGQSLDRLLKEKGPLSWDATLKMAAQIGSALQVAHKHGFLHRDVKPSNIICTPEGDYILTDFGLQRALMSTGLTSHTGAGLGTPPYIAPEIWEGKDGVPATDLYSLACVVFEALTGELLFPGKTPPGIMTRHMLTGPKFEDGWSMGLPQGVENVLRKALAKAPDERYPDIPSFVKELEKLEFAEFVPVISISPNEFTRPQYPEITLNEFEKPIIVQEHSQPFIEDENHKQSESPIYPVKNWLVGNLVFNLKSPVWFLIIWAIGGAIFLISMERYNPFILAIGSVVISFGMGVVFWSEKLISNFKSILWIMFGWTIISVFEIFIGFSFMAFLIISPLIGGLSIGLVMRKEMVISNMKSILWITLGWSLAYIASILVYYISAPTNPIIITGATVGVITGLIGGSIMLLQINGEQR